MKIFETNGKINFVDDNNVFVGFDYSQSCCEDFGWSLSHSFPASILEEGAGDIITDGFQFDKDYHVTDVPNVDVGDGGIVVFKLINENEETIFLTLWNSHNGYYGHGFSMTCDDKCIFEGYL